MSEDTPSNESPSNNAAPANSSADNSPPNWFIIVSALALLWNLIGVMAFYAQVTITPEDLALMPVIEQDLINSVPLWVNIAFGISVICGSLGCVLLMIKKSVALQMLILSALGVAVQMYYSFVLSNSLEVYGKEAAAMPLMIMFIAVALVWLAKSSQSKKWIS